MAQPDDQRRPRRFGCASRIAGREHPAECGVEDFLETFRGRTERSRDRGDVVFFFLLPGFIFFPSRRFPSGRDPVRVGGFQCIMRRTFNARRHTPEVGHQEPLGWAGVVHRVRNSRSSPRFRFQSVLLEMLIAVYMLICGIVVRVGEPVAGHFCPDAGIFVV